MADEFSRNSFECVDIDAEAVPGTSEDINGALFHTSLRYFAPLESIALHMKKFLTLLPPLQLSEKFERIQGSCFLSQLEDPVLLVQLSY